MTDTKQKASVFKIWWSVNIDNEDLRRFDMWELCPFELRNFPKYTSEAACQHNSSETTEQNFMKLGR
jgi:hypothetical protein